MNIYQLVCHILPGNIDLKGNRKQRQYKEPVVLCFIPNIGNTLVGKCVILPVIEHGVITKGWLGIALHQSGGKCSVDGLDLLIPMVNAD